MFALDTIGRYNPVTSWLTGAMSQIGFINIRNMSAGDSDLEKSIIRDVGSYGRQLGRITEALQAVCSHLDYTNWGSDDQQAVMDFTGMAREIEAHKRKHQPETKVLQRLRKDLLAGGAAALPPTSGHHGT
jgi:predicted mannosyl-3-phosphoglycerate phosphatase (HAD superfamily)